MTEDEKEALALIPHAHAWIDDLVISGVSESAAISAIETALIERNLTRGGVDRTLAWMGAMVTMVERCGAAMLAQLREQGR